MKKRVVLLLSLFCAVALTASDQPKISPMPLAVTGNAVTAARNGVEVYSFMGIGTKRTWDDITSNMYVLPLKSGKWIQGKPVPGVAGRLGAAAIAVKGQIYLVGGYTVDGQGNELVVGDVNAYVVEERRWYRAPDIPVPVDDAVIGVAHDRYIYLVGGRSKNGLVNKVQMYDVEKGVWSEATAFPGPAVFGHAGAVADEAIVYVDGAKIDGTKIEGTKIEGTKIEGTKTDGAKTDPAGGNRYVASDECWMGKIDKKDPEKIEWSKLPAHPGTGRFGIVAGAAEHDHRILFSGGTTAPHDYKGLDANGKPAELSPVTFSFDVHTKQWDTITEETYDVRADSRGIAFSAIGPLIVGGTLSNSAVSARVLSLPKR